MRESGSVPPTVATLAPPLKGVSSVAYSIVR